MEKQRARSQAEKEFRAKGIIESAKKIYLETPTHLPEVAKIINQAGMAKGSFYNYFDSKEEIFLEILRREYKNWFYNFSNLKLSRENIWEFFKPLIQSEVFIKLCIHGQIQNSEGISVEKKAQFQSYIDSHIEILSEKVASDLKINKQQAKQNIQQSLSLILGHQLYVRESEFLSSMKNGLTKIWVD